MTNHLKISWLQTIMTELVCLWICWVILLRSPGRTWLRSAVGSSVVFPSELLLCMVISELQESRPPFMNLSSFLESCLLIPHWQRQVTWPSPESMWEATAQAQMQGGVNHKGALAWQSTNWKWDGFNLYRQLMKPNIRTSQEKRETAREGRLKPCPHTCTH